MTITLEEPLMTVTEAARFVGVAPGTVRRWLKTGELPKLQAGSGGAVRIEPRQLRAFLKGEADGQR